MTADTEIEVGKLGKLGPEEVVKIEETSKGAVLRTYYCIHDPELDQWMSRRTLDGEIWTRLFSSARRFRLKRNAEQRLLDLHLWRNGMLKLRKRRRRRKGRRKSWC